MPRKFKRGQLRKVKEALNEQLLNEVTEEASEDETEQLSKDDVKRLFKETAEPGENKKSKRKQVNKAKKRLSKQKVIPQKTLDYSQNLKKIKPHFVVHGDDWKKGVQKNTRKMVIQLIKRWSGVLIEVKYTKNISSSMLKKRLFKDLKKNNE